MPISISVVSAEDIARNAIFNFADTAQFTPGVELNATSPAQVALTRCRRSNRVLVIAPITARFVWGRKRRSKTSRCAIFAQTPFDFAAILSYKQFDTDFQQNQAPNPIRQEGRVLVDLVTDQYTLEVRLSDTGEQLDYVAGVFRISRETAVDSDW